MILLIIVMSLVLLVFVSGLGVESCMVIGVVVFIGVIVVILLILFVVLVVYIVLVCNI